MTAIFRVTKINKAKKKRREGGAKKKEERRKKKEREYGAGQQPNHKSITLVIWRHLDQAIKEHA